MAVMISLLAIACASIFCPLVYIIFKFTMKEKTFDEVIAEQRKQLALEHNLKNKTKYQQTRKYKNVIRERPHVDKRNKVVPPHVVVKESKKTETSKITQTFHPEKVDNTVVVTKKKSEKFNSKNANGTSISTSVLKALGENGEDSNYDRSDNNDNNNNNNSSSNSGKKSVDFNSNPLKENASNNEKVLHNTSKNDTENSNNKINIDGGECITDENGKGNLGNKNIKTTVSSAAVQLENIDLPQKGKIALSDPQEKFRESKKQFVKQDNEDHFFKYNTKPSQKVEEKNVKDLKSSKQKADDKLTKPEETLKKTEENKAEEKLLQSPSKNKKCSENVNHKNGDSSVVTALVMNNTSDEQKGKNESKKLENGVLILAVEQVIEKGNVNLTGKLEKPISNNILTKKQNGNGNVIASGKHSPTQNGKNQKQSNIVKTNKRQSNEIKTWQKISNENNGPVNVNLLMPLIAKAELSRSEIQNLIDLLLNKQQENCLIDTEWIESGRQDPIVKLKKQLAEKEKILCDEQEAHQAIQNKLKELRVELNVEKHNNRQLEETLNNRQTELQALNVRLQTISDEKHTFTQQMQQLQTKLNEERMIVHSLKEENSKTKSNLQQELLSQRQQLEMHIAHLNEQHQQEILALETQLGQLATQLQEQETTNAQMSEEIRECVLLRERLVHQENQIAHLQQTVIQLEELRPIKAELERHLASSQYEVTRLSNELKSLTDQLNRRNAEIDKFNCTIQNIKIENQELIKENSRNNEQINFAYNEKAQLQLENEKLNNSLKALQEQRRKMFDLEKMENDLKSHQNAITEKNIEISQLNQQVVELEESKEQYLSRNTLLETILKEQNKVTDEIKEDLQRQLKKNDDLRCKNWKAMEALSNMEKTLESKMKGMQCIPHEMKIKEREEILRRIKLLLPSAWDITSTPSVLADDDSWFSYVEKLISELRRNLSFERQPQLVSQIEENIIKKEGNVLMLDELEKQNKQLQTMVSHYKSIISDTEGMLNSLQNHVELEENRWSEQVQILQAELNAITEERNSLLLKTKVQNGCVENDSSSCEQKVNGNIYPPLLATSSIKESTITS